MEDQPEWKAKTAFIGYIALAAGIFAGSIILAIILLIIRFDFQEPTFPIALVSLPINEGIILGIILLFARQKGANLKQLGFKKPKIKTIVVVSSAAVLLLLLAAIIAGVQEAVIGPDPEAELLADAVVARDIPQLIALLAIVLVLVGPIEELAFRGFVQKGFENSFGKTAGLLIASILFGLLHGLNSFRSILPVTVVSLFLGYVWQKTDGNTAASAVMHGVYDAIAIAITYFAYA